MLWSRLGKDIDKTLVGKDLGLCQVVHAVDHQKNRIFVPELPGRVCLCMVAWGRADAAVFPLVLKRKKIQFVVRAHGPSGRASFPPCYFWKDVNAGLC